MKAKIFVLLLIVSGLLAVFSAGQVFHVLPKPEMTLIISVAALILLSIGFFLGTNGKDNNK